MKLQCGKIAHNDPGIDLKQHFQLIRGEEIRIRGLHLKNLPRSGQPAKLTRLHHSTKQWVNI